jgi:polyhydroxybutyrate depolymerase
VHIPPGFDRSRAFPLVLVLHGGTGNAFFTAYNTGMSATADREGFIVVYPNGTGRFEDRVLTWNVGFGFGYALRNNVDDIAFLRELVARMEGEYGTDPRHVYATGISNGGIMSYRLASEAPDLVTAIAPVAGAAAGRKRSGAPLIIFPAPHRPVSVIAFHGMQDRLIPYEGGQGAGIANADYLPVQNSINLWIGYNGCSPTPATWTSPSGNIIRQWYGGGNEGSEVVLFSIRDGGHNWPGGTSIMQGEAALNTPGWTRRSYGPGRMTGRLNELLGTPTQEISANELMWEFFKRH